MGILPSRVEGSDPGVDVPTTFDYLKRKSPEDETEAIQHDLASLQQLKQALLDAEGLQSVKAILAGWYRPDHSAPLKTLRLAVSYGGSDERQQVQDETTNADDGIYPSWNPVIHGKSYGFMVPRRGSLDIGWIAAVVGFRNQGMGRAVVNTLQQAMADAPEGPWFLSAHSCYFPTFYTVDSHYGWWAAGDLDKQTRVNNVPPRLVYPRYLGAHTPEENAVNREAVLGTVDLCWMPPEAWHLARMQFIESTPDEMPLPKYSLTWNEIRSWPGRVQVIQRRLAKRQALELSDDEDYLKWADGPLHVVFRPLSETMGLMPSLSMSIAAVLSSHGNDDGLTKDVISMGIVGHVKTKEAYWACVTMLAYLVDYARVVYRPIVLSQELVVELHDYASREAGNPLPMIRMETIWKRHWEIMPTPNPYFAHVGSSFIWVPIRKPHSTSSYAGTDHLLPTWWEPAPSFASADEPMDEEGGWGRPTKRPRLSCMACGAAATMHDHVHGFCGSVCHGKYYGDMLVAPPLTALQPACCLANPMIVHLASKKVMCSVCSQDM